MTTYTSKNGYVSISNDVSGGYSYQSTVPTNARIRNAEFKLVLEDCLAMTKKIADLDEKLFTQSQESKDTVQRAIEIILEKDELIAELEKVISLDVKLTELAVKKRIAGNKKQWEG